MPGNNDEFKYYDDIEDALAPNEYDEYYEGESLKTQELKHKYNGLRTKLLSLEVGAQQEKLDRLTNPPLNDAWERYQILLKLTRNN